MKLPAKIFTLLVVFMVGFLSAYYIKAKDQYDQPLRIGSNQYKFIFPLLAVNNDKIDFSTYKPLGKQLENTVADYKKDGIIDDVSFYFRDLKN